LLRWRLTWDCQITQFLVCSDTRGKDRFARHVPWRLPSEFLFQRLRENNRGARPRQSGASGAIGAVSPKALLPTTSATVAPPKSVLLAGEHQQIIASRQSSAYTTQALAELALICSRERLMAKIARQTAVKKTSKATPAPIKPVNQVLTKSALVNLIAEENEIPRKTAAGVYATLENLFLGSVHPRGVGEFVLPVF
jgi:hypothetical protein